MTPHYRNNLYGAEKERIDGILETDFLGSQPPPQPRSVPEYVPREGREDEWIYMNSMRWKRRGNECEHTQKAD